MEGGVWFLRKLEIDLEDSATAVKFRQARDCCQFRQYLTMTFRLYSFCFVSFWFGFEIGSCYAAWLAPKILDNLDSLQSCDNPSTSASQMLKL